MGINCGKAVDVEVAADINHKPKKESKESIASAPDPMQQASYKINSLKAIKEKYDSQVTKTKLKIAYYGQAGQKEDAMVYLRFLDLVNYEIQLISQRILDFEYILENPNQSISGSKSSLFCSVIEQKYQNVDVDIISISQLSEAIQTDYLSFVKSGNTTDDDLSEKYDAIFKSQKKKHREITHKDFEEGSI